MNWVDGMPDTAGAGHAAGGEQDGHAVHHVNGGQDHHPGSDGPAYVNVAVLNPTAR